jgi:hypothetical protein
MRSRRSRRSTMADPFFAAVSLEKHRTYDRITRSIAHSPGPEKFGMATGKVILVSHEKTRVTTYCEQRLCFIDLRISLFALSPSPHLLFPSAAREKLHETACIPCDAMPVLRPFGANFEIENDITIFIYSNRKRSWSWWWVLPATWPRRRNIQPLLELWKAHLLPRYVSIWGSARTVKSHEELRQHLLQGGGPVGSYSVQGTLWVRWSRRLL